MMTENELFFKVIGIALDLHKSLGLGLLESTYECVLNYDLRTTWHPLREIKD